MQSSSRLRRKKKDQASLRILSMRGKLLPLMGRGGVTSLDVRRGKGKGEESVTLSKKKGGKRILFSTEN